MGEAIITRPSDVTKNYVNTQMRNSMTVNTNSIRDQHIVVTGGTPYEFCTVNFPAGYMGLFIATAIVTANQNTNAKTYLGYGIDNDSYTSYLQTAEIHSDTSDHYINATFFLGSLNSDSTAHGTVATFVGQNFEFNRGNVQIILFKDYGINSLVNCDEASY